MIPTVFIPAKHLKPTGKVDLWDLGPTDETAYKAFEERYGGPVRIEQWAVDARHTLGVESKRYKLVLPKGVEPGVWQKEMDARVTEESEQTEAADPHFGQGKVQ